MKKGVTLLILILVIASFLTNISMVSAANDPFSNFVDLFNLKDPTSGLYGLYAKWLFLFLVILLVYSSLSMVSFPEQATLRFIVSVIVGLLGTILISNEEIISVLTSYTAMGMAIIIFIPILILTFFTFAVASKASPFGILIQKIMWIIYSFYLFLKVGTALMIQWGPTGMEWLDTILFFLAGNESTWNLADSGDTITLIILLIVAIAVFLIFVLSNKPIVAWMEHEAREADLMKTSDDIKRSQRLRKEEAQATREAGRR